MGFLPTIRQRFQSDLQYRLGLVAYVPILCLGVLAAGGLIFLPGSTGVRVYGIFGLLGVALSAYVAHRIIKSELDSLDVVAGSAGELVAAQEALLANNSGPIELWRELDESGADELGALAGAVNSMHRNTLEIDRNQNESIKKGISNIVINLARRSQALLDRQVEYIDQLENTEEDPDRLEQMFKVDHLATRMRRNAESLLVLAEADPGRRRGGPVDVADVLRVAMGEIENYQHIELTSVEPGQVTAAAAVDLAHMAAELMENATQFSPPDAPVEVSGRLDAGQYLISIVDHGMGMPADQLELANATLVDPPELGLAMGRSLGFVVIGRLAERLGASVELRDTTESGITAQIAVPTSAFTQVGDNSGVRRSVVAPESKDADEASAPADDHGQNRSPALSKLLGLDVASLGGGSDSAGAEPEQTTGAAASQAEDQQTWTPPPVTPDAPISLPAEVAASIDTTSIDTTSIDTTSIDSAAIDSAAIDSPSLDTASLNTAAIRGVSIDGVPDEPAWSPPAVAADAGLPLSTRASAEKVPTSVDDKVSDDVTSEAAIADGLPVTGVGDAAPSEPTTPPSDPDQADGPNVQTGDEESWSAPPVVADAAAETVPIGRAPSKLEDAIPTGEAFETGMASLLDDATPSADTASDNGPGADGVQQPTATSSGLTRRKRGQSNVPIGEGRPVAASSRNPEEIRSMLSRYRDGIKGNKSPADPGEEG